MWPYLQIIPPKARIGIRKLPALPSSTGQKAASRESTIQFESKADACAEPNTPEVADIGEFRTPRLTMHLVTSKQW